jgi:hypothetical protein
LTQKQSDKHEADAEAAKQSAPHFPINLGEKSEQFFTMPKDHNWALAKQKQRSVPNKNTPSGLYPNPELVAESMEQFRANVMVDEKVREVLSTTEQGKEFLEANPNGPTPSA